MSLENKEAQSKTLSQQSGEARTLMRSLQCGENEVSFHKGADWTFNLRN